MINSAIKNGLKQEFKSPSAALIKDFSSQFKQKITEDFNQEFNKKYEIELDKQLDRITDRLLENKNLDIFKVDKELEKIFSRENPEKQAAKQINQEIIINEIVRNYVLKFNMESNRF